MSDKKDVLAAGVSLAESYCDPEFQRFCDWLWRREARGHCVSALFAEAILPRLEELGIEYDELVPVIDYEDALSESGYEWREDHGAWVHRDSLEAIEDWEAEEPDRDDFETLGSYEEAVGEWEDEEPDLDLHGPISLAYNPEFAFEDLGLDRCDFEREVYEYWAVSDWWGDQLEMEGETCPEILGLRIWLRTCTGQKTTMDSCTLRVARRLLDIGYDWGNRFRGDK